MIPKQRLKDWIPPHLMRWGRKLTGRSLRFVGRPQTWQHAMEMSTGYMEGSILDRVADATRLVNAGKAVFERDGVVFHSLDYSYPLLACLLHAAAGNNGELDVVDFGGALGSTYRQCRPFFAGLEQVRWRVIEQPNFVDLGRREFETAELTFYSDVSQLPVAASSRRVLLLSSVLQYIENPLEMLRELTQLSWSHVIIDRTPVSDHPMHRLCVQEVPPNIYKASYPCWILAKDRLLGALSEGWTPMCEFPCHDGQWETDDGLEFEFRGFLFLPKSQHS